MKEEVKRWMEMSKDDLESARANFKIKKYYVCAFLCQQAVEKALKALLIKKYKKLIKTHDLVLLGRKTGLSDFLIEKCKLLSRVSIETRYGFLDIIPSKKFNRQNSLKYLNIAKEIVKWVEKRI